MKKTIVLAAAALILGTSALSAQTAPQPRKKYVNLGYVSGSLRADDAGDSPKLKAGFGVSFSVGRSYYLHRKPIARMIRFGIDATWLDMNYLNYSLADDTEKTALHQAEIGMQVGPSLTLTPVRRLLVHAWFRYAPSFALLYDHNVYGNYASFFTAGGSVSFGAVGVGAEARWGKCSYKKFGGSGDEPEAPEKPRLKTGSVRVFLSFRF